MPDRKKLIEDFYSKYAPEQKLTDDRLNAINNKYKDDDRSLISDFYKKYAPDQTLSDERFNAISKKYSLGVGGGSMGKPQESSKPLEQSGGITTTSSSETPSPTQEESGINLDYFISQAPTATKTEKPRYNETSDYDEYLAIENDLAEKIEKKNMLEQASKSMAYGDDPNMMANYDPMTSLKDQRDAATIDVDITAKKLEEKVNKIINPQLVSAKSKIYDADGNVKEEYLSNNYYGFKVPNLDKINEEADKYFDDKDAGLKAKFKKSLEDEMQFSIDIPTKKLDSKVEENYKKEYGKSLDEEIGSEYQSEFKNKYGKTLLGLAAKNKSEIDSVNTEYTKILGGFAEKNQAKVDGLSKSYKESSLALQAEYEQLAANNIPFDQKEYTKKQENLYTQYVSSVDEIVSEQSKLQNEYGAKINRLAAQKTKAYNELATKFSNELSEKYNVSKDIQGKIESVTQKSVKELYDESRKNKEAFISMPSLFRQNPLTERYITSTLSSFGSLMQGWSTSFGGDGEWGEKMEQYFQPNVSPIKSFKDLSLYSVVESGGNLTGSMLPSIGTGIATGVATRNASMATRIIATGLSGLTTETIDMAGRAYKDALERTGSKEQAKNAASETIDGQISLSPLYMFEGLPFVGAFKKISNPVIRVGTGTTVEYASELMQEYPQGLMEQSIQKTGDYENFTDYASMESFVETGLNMIPVTILGGLGAVNKEQNSTLSSNPDIAMQQIGRIINKKGKDLAKLEISQLYQNGNINEETLEFLGQEIDNYNTDNSEEYNAIKFKRDQVAQAAEKEEDPVKKKLLNDNVKAFDVMLESSIKGEALNLGVVEVGKEGYIVVPSNPIAYNEGRANEETNGKIKDGKVEQSPVDGKKDRVDSEQVQQEKIKQDENIQQEQQEELQEDTKEGEGIQEEQEILESEISDYISESVSKMSTDTKVGNVEAKIDNAESIEEQDLLDAQEAILDELDRVENSNYSDKAKAAITKTLNDLYNKLDNYEFRTETTTREFTQKTATRSPIENKREQAKSPQERIKGREVEVAEGSDRTVIEDGQDGGLVVQYFDDSGNRTESVKLDAESMNDFELSETIKDDNGVVVGAVLKNKNNPNETFTINDQDLAYDLAIEKTKAELGKVSVEEQVVATEQVKKETVKQPAQKKKTVAEESETQKPQEDTKEEVREQGETEQEEKVNKDVDRIAKVSGVKAKNIRGLYDINRKMFGQNRVKSLAIAVVTDIAIGQMAKRAGVPKSEMYGKIQFKKGDESTLKYLSSRGKALFQIVGENANLADNVRTNLQVARDMEAEGKDAKTIRIATGWEKSADGKWRYEILDEISTDVSDFAETEYANFDKTQKAEQRLLELQSSKNKVFTEEEAKDITKKRLDLQRDVEFGRKTRESAQEEYSQFLKQFNAEERIAENAKNIDEARREFERVSNLPVKKDGKDKRVFLLKDVSPSVVKMYPSLSDVAVEIEINDNYKGLGKGSYESTLGISITLPENVTSKNTKSILLHEIQHAIQDIEGFARGGSPESVLQEVQKELDKIKSKASDAERFMELDRKLFGDDSKRTQESRVAYNELAEKYNKLFNAVNESERIEAFGDLTSNELYKRLAGEVEARNVEKRASMTPEQRRETLLQETEDVARDEQVILFQGEQGAMLAEDGKYIIYALTDPNISTPLHELAHVYEHYLTDAERKQILSWAGKSKWDTSVSEKFARGFERYLANGKAPSSRLQKIFDKFKEWLTEIYNGIKGSEIDLELNEEMTKIYDAMLNEDVDKEEVDFNSSFEKGADAALDWIAQQKKDLDKFSKETMGINLPVAVAQSALTAAELAIKAGKSINQAINAAKKAVKDSDWYKGLSEREQAESIVATNAMFGRKSKIPPRSIEQEKPKPKSQSVESETQGLTPKEQAKQGVTELVDAYKRKIKEIRESMTQKIKDAKENAREKQKAMREVQKELSDFINEVVPKNLKLPRYIAKKIANVKTDKSALTAMIAIEDYVEKVAVANIKNNIKANQKKVAKKLKGTSEYTNKEGLVASLLAGLDLNNISDKARLDAINRVMEDLANKPIAKVRTSQIEDLIEPEPIPTPKKPKTETAEKALESSMDKDKGIRQRLTQLNRAIKEVDALREEGKDVTDLEEQIELAVEELNNDAKDEILELNKESGRLLNNADLSELNKSQRKIVEELKDVKKRKDYRNAKKLHDIATELSFGYAPIKQMQEYITDAVSEANGSKMAEDIDNQNKKRKTPKQEKLREGFFSKLIPDIFKRTGIDNKSLEDVIVDLRLSDWHIWDEFFGLGKVKPIARNVVSVLERAVTAHAEHFRRSIQGLRKLGLPLTKEDQTKMVMAMVQGYWSNYRDGADYWGELLNNKEFKANNKKRYEFLEKLYNQMPKKDGVIDYDGYLGGLKGVAKKTYDWIVKNNAEMKELGKTANERRGQSFEEIDDRYYIPMKRKKAFSMSLDGDNYVDNLFTMFSDNISKLKSDYGHNRKDISIDDLSTDLYALIQDQVYQTTRDYYVTEKARVAVKTLGKARARTTDLDAKKYLTAMNKALKTRLAEQFGINKGAGIGIFNRALNALYQYVLSGLRIPIEATAESMRGAGATNAKYWKDAAKIRNASYTNGLLSKILRETNSPFINQLYFEMIEDAGSVDFSRNRAKNLMKKLGKINEKMIASSDAMTFGIVWLPNFLKAYETVTGNKMDVDAFIKNPDKFISENIKEIKEAAAITDSQTQTIKGSKTRMGKREAVKVLPFKMEYKGKRLDVASSSTALGRLVTTLQNFANIELMNILRNVNSAIYQENKTRKEASAEILASLASGTFYGLATALTYTLKQLMFGDDEEKEDAVKEYERLTSFEGIVDSAKSNLLFLAGGKYGNISKTGVLILFGLMDLHYKKTLPKSEYKKKSKELSEITRNRYFADPIKFGGYKTESDIINSLAPFLLRSIGMVTKNIENIYDTATGDKDTRSLLSALNSMMILAMMAGGMSMPFAKEFEAALRDRDKKKKNKSSSSSSSKMSDYTTVTLK